MNRIMGAHAGRTEERVCATCSYSTTDDALFCPRDGGPLVRPAQLKTRAETDPYLSHVISGMIEIRSLIGIGAMGRVYRAFQRGVERQVAVKILHRELASNNDLVTRFLREAKVASRLEHPGVVQILLSGQLDDGSLYIAMEYLDGLSLQSALAAAGGKLPVNRALRIMIQLADAVGEAHASSVVHRDLKPENVMLVRRGENADFVKVLDFGIARVQSGDPTVATSAGLIFGTARYISPEGAQGERVGSPGDVYSLATMLYQMLSGQTPFDGEQAVTMLLKQVQEPPPELRTLAPDVPAPIAAVVMKNLAKTPAARDPDARTFARSLVTAATQSGIALDDVLRPSFPGTHDSRPPRTPRSTREMTPAEREPTPAPASADPNRRPPTMETRAWSPPNLDDAAQGTRETARQMEAAPPSSPPPRPGSETVMLDQTPVPSGLISPSASLPSGLISPSAPLRSGLISPSASLPSGLLAHPTQTTPQMHPVPGPLLSPIAPLVEPTPANALAETPRVPRAGSTEFAPPAPTSPQFAAYGAAMPPPSQGAHGPHGTQAHGAPYVPDDRRSAGSALLWVFGCFGVGAMITGGVLYVMQNRHPSGPLPFPSTPSSTVAPHASDVPVSSGLLPEAPLTGNPNVPITSPKTTSSAQVARARMSFSLTPERPAVGQTVRFVGQVTGASSVSGAQFAIRGTTMPNGVRITALPDGAQYRAEYTFLDGGKFDVTFSAKVDGADSASARSMSVGDVATPVPTLPPHTPPVHPTLTPIPLPAPGTPTRPPSTGPFTPPGPAVTVPPPTPVPSTTVRWM